MEKVYIRWNSVGVDKIFVSVHKTLNGALCDIPKEFLSYAQLVTNGDELSTLKLGETHRIEIIELEP